MCAAYGFDVTRPAKDAREAVQFVYLAYLAAVKDQDGAVGGQIAGELEEVLCQGFYRHFGHPV